ncbi:MAG TPA: bifunctional [glutamate--ammonia ligase]-adenylyl-L-tyrosine phosphorylase/[glutamate--ammonia-ligase] adenylyltransferase [Cellvibrio sp.]|nr:bifunctional [glutamate--ammonia ligase]-adenylyl-L-tyrosine phosphorylase/[glutamate--ammonia-ligase] adenylyltransferase [Cellvibrio sp.]
MLDLSQLPAPLHEVGSRFWQQFEQAIAQHHLTSPKRLLDGRVSVEAFSRQITRAFVGSEYLAKTCVQYPELLIELISSGELFTPLRERGYVELVAAAGACQTDVELDKTLRRHRHRAMVRIIWRDLNRLASMVETTAELSRFADTAIQQAAAFHYRQLVVQHGVPVGKQSGLAQPFIVLGMGKLGACELNVSSDIDLIFTYPEAGHTTNEQRQITNQEFFVKLGQRVIKSLDLQTADGFVFRVDMRLRPHGQSGALVLNFDALEDYYQTQGRDWERYAMIKARAVAAEGGEQADKAVANLMELLLPFTYRQYIDFSVIEALRDMKSLIRRQVQRKGMNLDVKLGEGGIREVEFVVQAFQLIRGGRDARLRDRQVCKMLPFLEQENYLPAGAGAALLEAYEFLRNTEHAIQAFQDRQTQSLPNDELGKLRLAWVMGFDSWDAFAKVLEAHRARVNEEFRAVIAAPEDNQSASTKGAEPWIGLWDGTLVGDEAQRFLAAHGCDAPEQLLQLLQQSRESRAVLSMQASSRTRLDSFMPRLLAVLGRFSASGEALAGMTETLNRILPLVESIARRSAYLVLLMENPTALHQLVKLCSISPWIADQLSHHPALLDELLTPESLYAPPDKDALRDDLRREVLRLGWDDLEGHMETLRYFRSAHALRVAASEVTGALPLMKVSDYLTYIAEVILEHVLELAWQQMVARHGRPLRDDGRADEQPDFIIVGYGKLGGIELAHGSDLDLVFIHNTQANLATDGEKPIDNLTFYTRLGQKIIHILNTSTISGKLYEVDMRLRPSGNSGLLVTSLAAFEKYQLNEAWTWEHQALVRARVTAGSAELAAAFEAVRLKVLCQQRELPALREEVRNMRLKMREQLGSGKNNAQNEQVFNLKQDAGGIVDIEFMVQYAVLAWAWKEPKLAKYTDNIRILGALEEAGLLDAESVAHLIDAYKAYRSTGHRLALQRQEAVLHSKQGEGEPMFVTERQLVGRVWQQLLDDPSGQ